MIAPRAWGANNYPWARATAQAVSDTVGWLWCARTQRRFFAALRMT
jgi:hypothetical protein